MYAFIEISTEKIVIFSHAIIDQRSMDSNSIDQKENRNVCMNVCILKKHPAQFVLAANYILSHFLCTYHFHNVPPHLIPFEVERISIF